MRQRGKIILLLILPALLFIHAAGAQAITAPADAELTAIVDSLESRNGEVSRLTTQEFSRFLAYAVEHERNLFEILNLVYPLLVERNQRYRIERSVVLESEETYRLGRSKLRVILPFDMLIAMEIGAKLRADDNAFDVFIEEHYSADFYGFGMLHEDPHFGFREIAPNYYNDAFGMYAKRMFFTLDVSRLHLYETEKVAIHLKNFFRPKREVFKAVRMQKK
jgi:hypothetical protein